MKKFFLIYLYFVWTIHQYTNASQDWHIHADLTTLFKNLFEDHCQSLKNINKTNKSLWICFSGTPGMGKTFVAKHIEERYQGIRISTDEIRTIMKSTYGLSGTEKIIGSYLYYFMEHYDGPNKLIIFDASIDRRYKVLFPLFDLHNIRFKVLRLEVPEDEIITRIKRREGENSENYLKHLSSWIADYHAFAQNYHDFYSITNSDKHADRDELFRILNQFLE